MGLFDKIKDNAKNISIRAIEESDEGEEYGVDPNATLDTADNSFDTTTPSPQDVIEPTETVNTDKPEVKEPEPAKEPEEVAPTKAESSPKVTEKPKEEKPAKDKVQEQTPEVPKPRQPYYKSTVVKVVDYKSKTDQKKTSTTRPGTHVIDITPQKIQDPVKREVYARERAAMSALASQRKLNGTVALYVTTHLNFKTRVYINRIEYSGSFGKNVLPIETVAWVKLRSGGTGIIIETTDGKRVVMVIKPKDRLDFADAVLKVQEMQPKRVKFKDTQTVRIDQLEQFTDDFDELEKLAKLRDKGIVTQEEFDTKKKKILGI
jgi:ribosomal protein S25